MINIKKKKLGWNFNKGIKDYESDDKKWTICLQRFEVYFERPFCCGHIFPEWNSTTGIILWKRIEIERDPKSDDPNQEYVRIAESDTENSKTTYFPYVNGSHRHYSFGHYYLDTLSWCYLVLFLYQTLEKVITIKNIILFYLLLSNTTLILIICFAKKLQWIFLFFNLISLFFFHFKIFFSVWRMKKNLWSRQAF